MDRARAEERDRRDDRLRGLVLAALAHDAAGAAGDADAEFVAAVTVAEPEGFVRPFIK